MKRFRNWIATVGALVLGIGVLPVGVGAQSGAPSRPAGNAQTPDAPAA